MAKTFAVPQRRYSPSRLRIRPGAPGMGVRTSACNWTGRSSRHTTGSGFFGGFSSRSRMASILSMYSRSSFPGMHHIFFPPRLQAVPLKNHPNRFPAHRGHNFLSHGLFRQECCAPYRYSVGRLGTSYCDDSSLLPWLQKLRVSWTRHFSQSSLKPVLQIAPSDLASRFRSDTNSGCGLIGG